MECSLARLSLGDHGFLGGAGQVCVESRVIKGFEESKSMCLMQG